MLVLVFFFFGRGRVGVCLCVNITLVIVFFSGGDGSDVFSRFGSSQGKTRPDP